MSYKSIMKSFTKVQTKLSTLIVNESARIKANEDVAALIRAEVAESEKEINLATNAMLKISDIIGE